MKTTFAIDGTGMAAADFFATGRSDQTSAVYFVNRLKAIQKRYGNPKIQICFDSSGSTFRHEVDSNYKGTRKESDPELVHFLAVIPQHLQRKGFEILAVDSYEADDLIATIALQCRQRGEKCVVVSRDKDIHQVIREGQVCQMIAWKSGIRGELIPTYMNASGCLAKYGVTPEQFIDYQMLVGDPTDNIIGVEGIGKKRASELLAEFGSVATLLENVWKANVSPRIRDALIAFQKREATVRQLVTLRTDVPIEEEVAA